MAFLRKRGIRFIAFPAALLICSGTYLLWMRPVLRTRPWRLESRIESDLASAATGSRAYAQKRDRQDLAAEFSRAKDCLDRVDRKWPLLRDYAACTPELMQAWTDAGFYKLKAEQERQNEKKRLAIMLADLRRDLDPAGKADRHWRRFDLRDIDNKRAYNLAQQAERLASENQVEAALTLILRARASFQKYAERGDSLFARFEDPGLRRKWEQQVQDLVQWSRKNGRRAILVDKLAHRCVLIRKGEIETSYRVSLGRSWYLQKTRERDASTPEGQYKVTRMNPSSKYGLALLLNYPTAADHANLRTLKRNGSVPAGTRIGGNIEIHGGGTRSTDWTDGCIALEDDDMRHLYQRAYAGMPVTIVGSSRLGASLEDP